MKRNHFLILAAQGTYSEEYTKMENDYTQLLSY